LSVFNNILVASEIEKGAIDTLVKWLPTYLREVERQLDIEINSIPRPEHFSNRNSFDINPGEKYPKVVCISPGLAGPPLANGKGQYSAVWRLGVGIALGATDEAVANMWAKAYGAACRAIMLNYQSLGGLANSIRWEDETYEDLPVSVQNMLFRAASIFFLVDCENVVTKWSGPENPDEDPYAYGIAESVIIDIVKVPVEDSVEV